MTKANVLVLIKTASKRLEDVLWKCLSKANIFFLIKTSGRCLQDIFWRRRQETSSRHPQDVFIKANGCWDNLPWKSLPKIGNLQLIPIWQNLIFCNSLLDTNLRPVSFTLELLKWSWINICHCHIVCSEILFG